MELKTQNLKELYEKDFYLWVLENLKLLKNKEFELVDWENLLEEIEDMAKRDFESVISLWQSLWSISTSGKTTGNPLIWVAVGKRASSTQERN
jgi:hypothetical protein